MRSGGPLRRDSAKTAAFHRRGRGTLNSNGAGLKRTKLKAKARGPRVATPPAVWEAVLARDGGLCVWSRYLGRKRRAEHPHHLLPKQTWPQYAAVRENIVGLLGDRHMTHEFSPRDRLPWDALPVECQAFLRRVAAGDARALRLIETKYPADGASRNHPVRRQEHGR